MRLRIINETRLDLYAVYPVEADDEKPVIIFDLYLEEIEPDDASQMKHLKQLPFCAEVDFPEITVNQLTVSIRPPLGCNVHEERGILTDTDGVKYLVIRIKNVIPKSTGN
ncbi:MAG: hypothetical protein AAB731_03380 [Patescibacteria group bacterium]